MLSQNSRDEAIRWQPETSNLPSRIAEYTLMLVRIRSLIAHIIKGNGHRLVLSAVAAGLLCQVSSVVSTFESPLPWERGLAWRN